MKTLKRFFKFYKPHKKLFIFDLICSFIIAACNLFYPMIARQMMNDYIPNKNLQLLIIWAVALATIYVVKAILTYIVGYYGHVLGVKIQGDMREALFEHIETLPFSYFDNNKTGSIMSRITNDLFEVSELAHHGPEEVFTSLISILGAIIMLLTINPYLALMVFCYIPLMVFFTIKSRRNLSKTSEETRKQISEINAEIESSISGIRVTKAYDAQEVEKEKFKKVNEDFKIASYLRYKAMGAFQSGMSAFNDFLYFFAMLLGGLLALYNKISLADFTAFILFVNMLIAPLRTLVTLYEQVQNGMTGFKRFLELTDVESEYEPTNPTNADVDGDIEFKDVTFGYKQDLDEVLKGISFTVKKGRTVALVGSSGGGKTTICHLLPRFYLRDSGIISIGGIDINDLTSYDLRKNIAVVQQDVFLFAGSIKENIAYGSENKTDEEIIEAAKKANIHDFAISLPNGYDTEVGERGIKLSGGQKQRIAIARAFLKNPSILILDEATSALDNITEMQIQKSLYELSQGRTVLVVAHRLSTVKNADEILVVENGQITEQGSHDELIEKGGTYAELYSFQFRE